MTRVAVVTGSNKGIGFAIVRGLCKKFEGDVFLTARNEENGKEAVSKMNTENLSPKFHQLDIDDKSSIEALRDFLVKNYGGLDLLVNNAGIAYKVSSTAPFAEQAEVTVKTNFFSTLNACDILFPILKPHARVVNVSSMVSSMALQKCNAELKAKFVNDSAMSMEQLKALMNSFVSEAQSGTHQEKGWPNSAYGVSKIGVTVMTKIQQRCLKDDSRPDIVVNCCCPGYVATDMSSHKGHLTIDQGAEIPLYLALLPENVESPKGEFLSQMKVQTWS